MAVSMTFQFFCGFKFGGSFLTQRATCSVLHRDAFPNPEIEGHGEDVQQEVPGSTEKQL